MASAKLSQAVDSDEMWAQMEELEQFKRFGHGTLQIPSMRMCTSFAFNIGIFTCLNNELHRVN